MGDRQNQMHGIWAHCWWSTLNVNMLKRYCLHNDVEIEINKLKEKYTHFTSENLDNTTLKRIMSII